MRYFLRRFFLLLGGLFIIGPHMASAQSTYSEQITHFDVKATIHQDQRVEVQETIEYDFGSLQRHGIFRHIPTGYDRDGAKYYLLLDLESVTQDGKKATYTTTKKLNSFEVKIGDADKYLTGKHTYVIRYTVKRALNAFPEDQAIEWYWNVTGNEWNIPILSSSVVLTGPGQKQDALCFTGVYGSTEKACAITQEGEAHVVRSTRPFMAREGLTVAFRFPLDSVKAFSTQQKIWFWMIDNAWAVTPLAVFIIMFALWWTKGRDPKGRGTIIAQYEEPERFNALQMTALLDDAIPSRAISATILDLARRGYLHIDYEGKKNKTMHLVKDREADASLSEAEETLFRALFKKDTRVDTGDRIDDLYIAVAKARESTMRQLQKDGYYEKRPGFVRGFWYTAAFVVPILMMMTLTAVLGQLMIVSAIISGVIMMFFAHHMPRVTRKGAIMREEILGFKKFLSVTEEKRLEFSDAPEKKPEAFARFLPAAVAFGVEKKWANQFKDMQVPTPEYIHGYQNFNVGSFVHTVHAMESDMASSYAAPSSSGSGGSGFSGGGSGGGGGGGGGGSW